MKTTKVKVSEATNAQLDWLVAKCEGMEIRIEPPWHIFAKRPGKGFEYFTPSTNKSQMNPIIKRERISMLDPKNTLCWPWMADKGDVRGYSYGPDRSPLVAAARCHIVSEPGPIVEVPTVLVETTPMDSQGHTAADEQTADPAPGQ